MKFAAGTLFLGLSVFLYSIELISSQPKADRAVYTKLEKLFPHSNGSHFPPIEKLDEANVVSIPKFRILNGQPLKEFPPTNFLRRGEFIFAYEHSNMIRLLTEAFREPLYIYPVFDIKNHKWYTLHIGELQQLGVGRNYKYVLALEEAHAATHEPSNVVNLEAHNAARKVAYTKTRKYEATLEDSGSLLDNADTKSLKEHYIRTYNQEYKRHAGGPSGGR